MFVLTHIYDWWSDMRYFFTCILYYKMNKDGFWGKASHLAQCRHRAMWLRLTFTQMMQNHPVFGRLFSWWRRQMEAFSVLLALCAGNSSVTGEFPSQRPVSGVFFDLHLSKRLSKQSRRQCFYTPSHSLWRHCNEYFLHAKYFSQDA